MKKPFRFNASIQADKARKLSILGYSGGLMRVSGWGEICIDLAGMEIPGSVTVLADHANELGSVIGSATAKVNRGQLLFEATCADSEAAGDVIRLLESGVQLQASVGVESLEDEFIRSGESITVNGQTITSENGFTLISKSRLREISITAIGADPSTSTTLAARAATKGRTMNVKAMLKAAGVYSDEEIDAMSDEECRAALKKCMKAGADEPDADDKDKKPASASAMVQLLGNTSQAIMAKAVDERWSEDRCRSEALNFIRASRPGAGVGVPGGSNGRSHNGVDTDHFAAGILIRAGYEGAAEKAFGARVMEQARAGGFHKLSLADSLLAAARSRGIDVSGGIEGLMIKADASSMIVNDLLSNVQNKLLEIQWQQSPPTWTSWCAERASKDFKPSKSLRPVFGGTMSPLGPSGEIQHGTITDNLISWQAVPFAKMLSIPMPLIIDDDIGGLSEAGMGLAMMAQRSLSDLVYAALMADTTVMPTDDSHGNYQSSASSALSATSLALAISKMRLQVAPNGSPLNLQPSVLVCPPSLEQTARALLHDGFLFRDQSADKQPSANPLAAICKLEIEPRLQLGCTSPIGGSTPQTGSSTRWYLFASPAALPAIIGGLGGSLIPMITTASPDFQFNSWSLSMRAIAGWGFSLGDYRASQKSAGA